MKKSVVKDERTIAIENASYRWSYLVLSYGLLLSTAYRAFIRNEASWDLLALVVVGGAISTLYQRNFRALPQRWLLVSAVAVVLAGVLAALIVLAIS